VRNISHGSKKKLRKRGREDVSREEKEEKAMRGRI